jgi:predicted alpha/beta superfamily hydrolase
MIVVGIDNTDRTRDLTPTHIKEDILYLDSSLAKTSGGGEKFISYLRKELIPYIDSHYPTQPFRMVIGHSFGGLMAMHMLIHHTDLFDVYVSIDPSMWWDNMKYLKQSEQLLRGKMFKNKTLFLGYANTMDEGMDTARVQKDISPMSRHIRSIISVDHLLKSKKNNGLQYDSKFYKDDSHTTVPLISTYDALRFIFRNYQFKLLTQDYVDSLVDLPGKFERHYKEVSRFFGYPVFPAEKLIQGWGNEFLQARQYKKAFGFFELNTRYYPRSASAHAALADYYVQRGEKQKAIQSFQQALQINEDAVTRKKLDDLIK